MTNAGADAPAFVIASAVAVSFVHQCDIDPRLDFQVIADSNLEIPPSPQNSWEFVPTPRKPSTGTIA
jgi:hypothetical protein